ncbi:MAG TPA: PTS sugar transporter subunit IIB [Clostridiaceae bacterium]|nr:PTS sugar transporter subunit IIB [Clostridiaceae bacterium]
MRNILVARVDDRLIHGQVMTAWVKSYPINHILIIDDELEKNKLLVNVYKAAVPTSIKLSVSNINDGISFLKGDSPIGENLLILAKVPEVFLLLLENDIYFEKLVVGGMGAKAGRKKLIRNLSASLDEIECLKKIEKKNVKTIYQMVPADKEIRLADYF